MAPDLTGLSEAQAAERLRAEGPNILPDPDRRGLARIALEVLREPMFLLLLGGGGIYLVLGDLREALVLAAFALLSVGIAVVQEYRSERVLEALRDLTNPLANVVRDGVRRRLPSRDLVRGDLIAIAEGERVPADALLRAGHGVEVDESLLTGEFAPVRKALSTTATALAAPGGEDTPFVFSGTLLVRGDGLAEVVATGPRSEIGKIGKALRAIESQPARLSRETRSLVRIAGVAAFLVCAAVVLIIGLARGSWLQALLGGVSIGMSMLPEEFPLVLTVFMVMGAWRISRARVLTRRASAIETLGSATVLCTDKTGTLTQNRMTLTCAWMDGDLVSWTAAEATPPAVLDLVNLGALASAPRPFDPMELAFHAAADTGPPDDGHLEKTYDLTPGCPAMAQVWAGAGGRRVAVKGAPEAVLRLCRLDDGRMRDIMAMVERMAEGGARVLAVAEARVGVGPLPDTLEAFALAFRGLVGLSDPLRPGVPAAVAECQGAGLRVVMVTGDYPSTARAIATLAGIRGGATLTGGDLRALSDEALARRVGDVSVFARILPEEKLRIVRAFKAAGEIVAMTGDGVNDAPALKAADIGIAMGARGTEVARAGADLVLLDDDFGSIVEAIRLGRRIYDNLQKAMGFVVAVHVPIAGLAILPLLLGLPIFLAPAHIAFLEMIIDPVCSLVFEAEAEEGDVMRRAPRDAGARLLASRALAYRGAQGVCVLVAVAATYVEATTWGLPDDSARATAFLALVLGVLGLVMATRSFGPVVGALMRPNRLLVLVAGVVLLAVLAVMAAPGVRELFHFGPPTTRGLLCALAGAGGSLVILDLLQRLYGLLTRRVAAASGARQGGARDVA
ncbi:cation-translocating P-type ATPase [Caulobacter sp. KR2-114]|uniref:cation-translocating P-type ATPase n=1 Tax=Caulobacter sp. KR2-114 TaxID=3400912 RepID=UPI003C03A084